MTATTDRTGTRDKQKEAERVSGLRLPYSSRVTSKAEDGSIAVMAVGVLLVLLGLCGFALDLSRAYNRKVELQSIADAAALAAARELNGTQTGISNGLLKASNVVGQLRYQYNNFPVPWSSSAIKFSSSANTPDSGWLDSSTANGSPNDLYFAKVDTNALDASIGMVDTILLRVLTGSPNGTQITASAVAGRKTINVSPLAVCALSTTPAAARDNPGPPSNQELVEYGFRRGVGYDLMQLNPGGTSPANFVIDPVTPPGTLGTSSHTAAAFVAPFVCSGRILGTRLVGSTVTVVSPFPIESVYPHLNTRFDQYTGTSCSPITAPPDTNIKSFDYTSIPWMSSVAGSAPGFQTAQSLITGSTLWTVADPTPAPTANTAPMYGPLWSFAKAVPYSSYTSQGPVEPASGYTPFAPSAWDVLYKPGQPPSGGYPATIPYLTNSSSSYFQAPTIAHGPARQSRRVLNVPLLQCPVGSGPTTATVLAIGKFFMTVPATTGSIYAEFAGLMQEKSLDGEVEIIQ